MYHPTKFFTEVTKNKIACSGQYEKPIFKNLDLSMIFQANAVVENTFFRTGNF